MPARTLYILRHAQADNPPGASDRDRPLSESGRRDAQAVARKMRQDAMRPDAILCSPARRTRETCEFVREVWPEVPASFPEHLYLASTGDLYELVKRQENTLHQIMLIGHNPGLHGLVRLLAGTGAPELITRIMGSYNTGSLSVLECETKSWTGMMPGGCALTGLLTGKELP